MPADGGLGALGPIAVAAAAVGGVLLALARRRRPRRDEAPGLEASHIPAPILRPKAVAGDLLLADMQRGRVRVAGAAADGVVIPPWVERLDEHPAAAPLMRSDEPGDEDSAEMPLVRYGS